MKDQAKNRNEYPDPMAQLATEHISNEFAHLDRLNATEIALLMNREDNRIGPIVGAATQAIGKLVEEIVLRMSSGGRILYFGAGTSGRLGVLDAAECGPTFHSPYGQVVGIIAGGIGAMIRAVEGAEDSPELGAGDLARLDADHRDTVVGIAASGRTPYVIGALGEAKKRGCLRAAVVAVKDSELARHAEHVIEVETGPEVLAGSTRLKAGSATKLVLNMISTAAMVRLGKTHGNLMVDMLATNEKLRKRAIRLVSRACHLDLENSQSLLGACQGELKTAIVSHWLKIDPVRARHLLDVHGGVINKVMTTQGQTTQAKSAEGQFADQPGVAVGIDGGGTGLKIRFQIIGAEKPSKIEIGPSALPLTHGLDGTAFEWIRRIKGWLLGQGLTPKAVGAIVAGTSGAGTLDSQTSLARYLSEAFPGVRVEVGSDAGLIGMPGGDRHGLVLIAGTGSIAWWEPEVGKVYRAGGWGPGADEGSGAWLAEEAIRMVSRAEDGRGPQTSLKGEILKIIGKDSVRALMLWRKETNRVELAGLAPFILAQAQSGDAVACGLRDRAIKELVELVKAVIALGISLGLPQRAMVTGGLFQDENFWKLFQKEVAQGPLEKLPWVRVANPVDGALGRAVELLQESQKEGPVFGENQTKEMLDLP